MNTLCGFPPIFAATLILVISSSAQVSSACSRMYVCSCVFPPIPPTLTHTTSVACSILFSFCCQRMLCVQPVGDSTVLKEKVAYCHLKRLKLYGGRILLTLLSGAKDNCSITDLAVLSEPITTCLHVTILYHVRAL